MGLCLHPGVIPSGRAAKGDLRLFSPGALYSPLASAHPSGQASWRPQRSAGGLGGDGERQPALVAINQNGPIELHAAPHQLKTGLAA